tara:strand:- start:127743 stop:128177 length:435 start_codon:yes stop_codon:yes gene_type:complete
MLDANDQKPATETGVAAANLAVRAASGTDRWLNLAKLVSKEIHLRTDVTPKIDEAHWMILLDIFVAQSEGRVTPFMSAAHASNVSVSTAQRHIHRMTKAGLVEQHRSAIDQRVTHVGLTDRGLLLVSKTLEAMNALRASAPTGR